MPDARDIAASVGRLGRGRGPRLVVEIGRRLLVAVRCTASEQGVRIDAAVRVPVPPEVDHHDAEALGRWVGETLRDHGIRPGPAVLCVPRDRAVLRRLVLPTADEGELPGMVHLAVQREVIVEDDEPVVDFVPMGTAAREEDAGDADAADEESSPGDRHTAVLAVALAPTERDRLLAVARAAGLKATSLTLRAHGAAALAARTGDELDHTDADARVLVVDLAGDAPEFAIVDRGRVRFSRAAETPAGVAGDAPDAQALALEADRAWMSWRIAGNVGSGDGEGGTVDAVLVLGPAELRDAVEAAIAERLGLHVASHAGVEAITVAEALARDDALAAASATSLAGLVLRRRRGEPLTNLLAPRRTADPAAARKRLVAMAAGLAIVLGGLLFTVAKKDLARLEEQASTLRAEARTKAEPYADLQRLKAQLQHLERWIELTPDWSGHLASTAGLLPEPGAAVLDDWWGRLEFGGFDYDDDAWVENASIEIVLDGEARDRTIADGLRGRLVAIESATARSVSSDAPGGKRLKFPFTFRLETAELAPAGVRAAGEDARGPSASAEARAE